MLRFGLQGIGLLAMGAAAIHWPKGLEQVSILAGGLALYHLGELLPAGV